MKYIMGVDPGLSGALAVICPDPFEVLGVWSMPTKTIKKGSSKRTIDLFALASLIDQWAPQIRFALIEEVHSMPAFTKEGVHRQGIASTFSFGKAFGIVLGMLASHNLPIYPISPSVWKGAMGLSSNKKDSIKRAATIHAGLKGDGQAEALLLAKFGERFYK